ncbi:hypothetical protein GCM10025876_16510 [Demequina litorisediminis]|uniref:Fructose-bisphosphate aldolase n=1 Tax=Demequina litorisediminis TaxID=1849022 RepID=A0ABQ6IE52_9MICO|nr:hypothetical protein GCM10025876_16510 [Demequina litorisediminis]
MAIATTESYAAMLDAAKAGGYAFPAINITSSSSVTAAIQGFAEAESDGIIQVSVGGGQYASGSTIKDAVVGSLALAAYARVVAEKYGVTIALHTDHCHKVYLEEWLKPLLKPGGRVHRRRQGPDLQLAHVGRLVRAHGGEPRHRRGACSSCRRPLTRSSRSRSASWAARRTATRPRSTTRLYSTPEDGIATIERLGLGERGRYLTAMTFGNVHGAYKPGAVKPASRDPR